MTLKQLTVLAYFEKAFKHFYLGSRIISRRSIFRAHEYCYIICMARNTYRFLTTYLLSQQKLIFSRGHY